MKTTEKLNNEELNLLMDMLSDLPVTDEQAEQTQAGAPSKSTPMLFLHCASGQHI